MKSHTTHRVREALAGLPAHVQRQARAAYKRFAADPTHPSLRFKQVHETRPIYSARVGLGYRALCVREGEDLIWFWVGSHAEYDRLLDSL